MTRCESQPVKRLLFSARYHFGHLRSFRSLVLKHLEVEGIPVAERQGMSVGRFLRDYPVGSAPADRNFFLYLAAYEDFAAKAGAALP